VPVDADSTAGTTCQTTEPDAPDQSFCLPAGKARADAAAAAGVKVFIFSTLEEIEHRVQVRESKS